MECVKTKVEAMGIDNIEGQHLEELETWTEIAKNIVCYDKDYNIIEAMEKSENEDNMRAIEMYEDYPERRYYDNYRYKTSGRFAPKGKGSYMPRRGYDEPVYYHMTPEMYEKYPAEYYRDMDRDAGRLYYTSNSSSGMSSQGGSRIYSDGRDSREGRSGQSRKSYMESKEIHKSNTPEDKEAKRKELDKWINDVTADIKELVGDMSNEEKTVLKAKIQSLHSSI